ncbi:hypothetical protein BDY19DRAFT_172115 [Irpex rosettiformis]|uniref:Uncharacterized protein n=1 Tax=Irpex rosettiformis TaxID=378272 RepID=A0ACB8U3L6_9APHY|nr:hypothetical protein BDY19DRAFT_172115 [Irpex rosettiformis]
MSEENCSKALLNEFKTKPRVVLAAARRGSLPDLVTLSNSWLEMGDIIKPAEALDALLHNLRESQVPVCGGSEPTFSTPVNRAFQCLVGVGKAVVFVQSDQSLATHFNNAWPGILAWSIYIFRTHVETQDKDDIIRKAALELLSISLYTISVHDICRQEMVKSAQMLEIATKIWIEDEDSHTLRRNASPSTCLLFNLSKNATDEGLQQVKEAAGGKPSLVAKLAVTRIENGLKARKLGAAYIMMNIDLIDSLSRPSIDIFRNALLSANAVWVVTSALVKVGNTINSNEDFTLVGCMVAGFSYLFNFLQSTDGFTWVSQAIRAGLLQAFCDCSPKFNVIPKEDLDMILSIFHTILPRYLVFRSVLESFNHSMQKVDCDPHRKRVMNSVAEKVWCDLRNLAEERFVVNLQATALKDIRLNCHNIKCQKLGTKEEMRACSACLHTYYCSRQCQAISWKEDDHKSMCKMKQEERLEGRSAAISKKDAKFFHDLAMRDARKHLPRLRGLAKKEHSGLTHQDVIIKINYTVHPPMYGLAPLTGYKTGLAQGKPNAEARNAALIEKVQQNRESYTLLESQISSGEGITCVLTLVCGDFWSSDGGLVGGGLVEGENDSDEDGETPEDWKGTALDDVDVFRMRNALNSILGSIGQGPAF